MRVAGAVFSGVLATLLAVAIVSSHINWVFRTLGWAVVIVYSANVITRWILSVLQREVVSSLGKAVLVTGCDTGFGLELSKRLSQRGFTVFACCLSLESEGARELSGNAFGPGSIQIFQLDVSKHDQVQAVVKKVEASLADKELWCVVNNAGVAIFSELEWCSMAVIEDMFNVNVLGAVRVTKAFLPLLRAGNGRVVVVASVAGHVTYPGFLSYSMTKHALVSFADGLRREMLKWGIDVVRIEPTMYKTRISRPDVLTGALDHSWERTPDAIKEAYGFPYYQDFKGRMQKIVGQARPYLNEVVDSMERAVMEVRPRIVYRCLGSADKVRLWVMTLLPTRLLDLLICHVIQPSHRQLSGGGRSTKSSTSSSSSSSTL